MDNLSEQIKVRELEINSLFEISKIINEKKPVGALYDHYEFSLKAQLKVKKLALFVRYEDWKCRVNFGSEVNLRAKKIHDDILKIKEECQILKNAISEDYNEFELISPIKYQNSVIAYLLLGGMERESWDSIALEIDIPFIRTFTNLMVVAIENRRLAIQELEQQAVRKELDIAKRVQNHLFPKNLPNNEKVKVFAKNIPHKSVGGDYYDYIPFDGGYFLCVADVSGKGIPAALLMSNFQAGFRTLVRKTNDISEIVSELNSMLLDNAAGDLFVTFFLFKYTEIGERIEYINAGHNPGYLYLNNEIHSLESGTTVLGTFEPLPFLELEKFNGKNFKLMLFSDGVSESENDKSEYFGEERIKEIMEENKSISANELSQKVIAEVDEFRSGKPYTDDLTLLVCENS